MGKYGCTFIGTSWNLAKLNTLSLPVNVLCCVVCEMLLVGIERGAQRRLWAGLLEQLVLSQT